MHQSNQIITKRSQSDMPEMTSPNYHQTKATRLKEALDYVMAAQLMHRTLSEKQAMMRLNALSTPTDISQLAQLKMHFNHISTQAQEKLTVLPKGLKNKLQKMLDELDENKLYQ